MNTNYQEISEKLKEIFKNRLNIDIMNEHLFNKELLGSEIRLQPRELIYIFFDIETIFNIKIKEEYIILNKFRTFNDICKIICNELRSVENGVS